MKKIGAILAAILIITISCTDQLEVDKPLDFGFFTLKTPSSWYKFSIQGYDSNVGGITNEQDSLLYDFGWY